MKAETASRPANSLLDVAPGDTGFEPVNTINIPFSRPPHNFHMPNQPAPGNAINAVHLQGLYQPVLRPTRSLGSSVGRAASR